MFATLNHSLDKDDRASMTHDKIVIEDNVWIGSHATILQGVTIGKNSYLFIFRRQITFYIYIINIGLKNKIKKMLKSG